MCIFDDFLTANECSLLRALGRPRLTSTLIEEGRSDPIRTSSGCWMPRGVDTRAWSDSDASQKHRQLMCAIEERIAHATALPVRNGEPCQLLLYGPGDEYRLHPDYLDEKNDAEELHNGGQRAATFVVYLSTVAEECGGATVFPRSPPPPPPPASRKAEGGRRGDRRRRRRDDRHGGINLRQGGVSQPHPTPLRIRPVEGRGVLWHNTTPDGRVDYISKHAGEPLLFPSTGGTRGGGGGGTIDDTNAMPEKWLLTKWIRERSFSIDEEAAKSDGF